MEANGRCIHAHTKFLDALQDSLSVDCPEDHPVVLLRPKPDASREPLDLADSLNLAHLGKECFPDRHESRQNARARPQAQSILKEDQPDQWRSGIEPAQSNAAEIRHCWFAFVVESGGYPICRLAPESSASVSLTHRTIMSDFRVPSQCPDVLSDAPQARRHGYPVGTG